MAYDLQNRIDFLLPKAIEAQDISSELEELQIQPATCKEELLSQSADITQSAAGLLEEYVRLEDKLAKGHPWRLFINGSLWRTIFLFGGIIFGLFYLTGLNLIPEKYREFYDNYFLYLVFILLVVAIVILVRAVFRQFQEYQKARVSLDAQVELIDAEILENGIKPFLRLYINDKKITSLETTLNRKDAPGLWAIMDTALEVPTETKSKVERMISSLSGGSIGIAGPRGVGKTTLLTAICHPDRKEFNGQPALTVMTSVPVKYDSKDFVLHLYSQICQKIIQLELTNNPRVLLSARRLAEIRILSGIKNLIFVFRFLFLVSVMFGFFGMFLTFSWLTLGGDNTPFVEALAKLEITMGDIFRFSLLLFIVGGLFMYVMVRSSNQVRQFRTNTKSSKTDELSQLLLFEAERRLDEINYQKSFSEEWSGGIKFPETIQFAESSAGYSYTKTRNQLSLPEIIGDYRHFINLVSRKFKILIGIDELDKITSSDVAQQFLNETKAIFGMRNCFYLVSVSDNALSNFERRGIAFRDEFDTSFDDVLFLETPNIEYDLALLRRRVIGMPLPFAYYCYTVSGGLPRDLIRVCRELFDIAQKHENATLKTVITESINLDLRSKIRAISIAATENLIEPEASLLFNSINKIDFDTPSPSVWIRIATETASEVEQLNNHENNLNRLKMIKLIEELTSYLLFSATTMQYYSRMGNENTIQQLLPTEIDAIEKLARAKQLVTSSPAYSRSVIVKFREQTKLDARQSRSKSRKAKSTR